MLKTLALHIADRWRIPVYLLLGIAMVPIAKTLIPDMMPDAQNVFLQECHKSCHVASGKEYCTYQCSYKDTQKTQRPVRH